MRHVTPTKARLGPYVTGYEALFQIHVPFKDLVRGVYPFGCKCYMHIPKKLRKHTHGVPKAVLCVHLGFAKNMKGYVVMTIRSREVIEGV